MSAITLLPYDKAPDILLGEILADPSRLEGVAELIRDAVSGHGTCRRSRLVREARRIAAPAFALDEASALEVCDLLEREGDVVLAPGGELSATPLRAVKLGAGAFRIVGSLPTRRLAATLSGRWERLGVCRIIHFEDFQQAEAAVSAVGGIVLTPEEWACLGRVPPADQLWIDCLDRRLTAAPKPPGSLERDETLDWRGCLATADGVTWTARGPDKPARLWRARDRWGHWLFAWTKQGAPSTADFAELTPDEGVRTVFAVARSLDAPVVGSMEKDDSTAVLAVREWLPRAEYRLLSVSASSFTRQDGQSRWTVPIERVSGTLDALRDRLGLIFNERNIE